MAEQIGRFKPGENLPVFGEEQLLAGRLVAISSTKTTQGDYQCKHAGANVTRDEIIGCVQRDTGPTTDPANSWTRRTEVQVGGVVRVLAAGAITAGKTVYCSGEGKVKEIAAEKNAIGVCMATVAEGKYAEVLLK